MNEQQRPVSVLVVDDHDHFRAGIARAIAADPRLVLSGEATSGSDALARLDEHVPDVLLLDLGLPDAWGLDLWEQIKRRDGARQPTCIVLSSLLDAEIVRAAESGGVLGCLSKEASREQILDALAGLGSLV